MERLQDYDIPREETAPRMPEQPQEHAEGRPHGPHGKRRHGGKTYPHRSGARLTAYLLVATLLNVLLALYALYAVGLASQFSAELLAGASATLTERIYQILLLLSPLFVTVLLNKLLYMGMRGRHHRFPRWAPPIAWLLVIAVQALTVGVILWRFMLPAGGAFSVDTLTSLLP